MEIKKQELFKTKREMGLFLPISILISAMTRKEIDSKMAS